MKNKRIFETKTLKYTLNLKFPLFMRISLVLIFASALQLYATDGYSQRTKTSLKMDNVTIEQVLNSIENSSDYVFLYNDNCVPTNKVVSVHNSKGNIKEILDDTFKGTNISYTIVDNQIILSSQNITSTQQSSGYKIKGTVTTEDGEPIIGATIKVVGTDVGTITDFNGTFSLNVDKNAQIIISYVGYETKQVNVGGNKSLAIVLVEDSEILDEVVVVGYGTQKKADLSSSIATLSSKEIGKIPEGLLTGLQSSVAGVQITNGRIRIRGVGSINDTDPLYVVDGMIGGAIPDDSNIESVQILKDAASCAIYGARGANGVILINTKRGVAGKVKVEYNGYAGLKEMQHSIPLLNGQDLAELINESLYNADPTRTDYMDTLSDPASIGKGYNMLDALKRTGFYQKHNLSLNGGSEKAHFRINGIYASDNSIFIKDKNQSYGLQFISDFERGKFKFGETFTIKRNNHDWSNKNVLTSLQWSSTLPFYDASHPTGFMGSGNGTTCGNALAEAHLNWNKTQNTLINGNVWATYDIIPGLTYKINVGVDFYNTMTQAYDGDYVINYQTHSPDQYDITSIKSNRNLIENTLTFDKTLGKHNINALVGFTSEQTKRLGVSAGARAMPNDQILSLGATRDNDSRTVGSSEFESAMFSILGRVNYSYDSKYMLTVNFRRDGSSNFSKSNRYGNFPSFSAAWRISKEKFMSNINFIDDLKLRGSWGVLGNSNINPYQYQNTVSFDKICYYINDKRITGGLPTIPSNPDVKWESQYTTDLGFDLTMLDNHFSVTFDYFYKKTKDMLVEVPISFTAGYMNSCPVLNAGSIENKGVEIAFTYRNSWKKFDYSLSANLSTVKNKVLELGAKNEIFASNEISKTVVGKPIGMFWGYVTDGLYTTQAQLDADKKFAPSAQLGDIRFKNLNGDDKLNADDQAFIGNPIPKFSYGLSGNLSYNSKIGTIDMSMIWQGSYGNDIYNNSRYYGEGMFGYTNCFETTLDRYRAEELVFVNPVSGKTTIYPKNTDTNMPRAVFGDPNQNSRKSDRYVEDGSYIRLKSLTLGYTLPSYITRKMNVEKLKFFLGGKNLLTFTGYSGFDPEVGDQEVGNNLTRGIDASTTWGSTFPNIREYYIGLELVF